MQGVRTRQRKGTDMHMHRIWRRNTNYLLAAVAVATFAFAPPAHGTESNTLTTIADGTTVKIIAIRATKKNAKIAPELRALAKKLKSQFQYTGFAIESKAAKKVAVGKPFSAKAMKTFEVKITPKKIAGNRVTLEVVVVEKGAKRLNTVYTISKGRYQLAGGWKVSGGDALIIAVTAQ